MRLRVAAGVQRALRSGRPVVALESSVIAQGLPSPQNLEAWRRCEAAVRAEGGEPATIAVIEGQPQVGIGEAEAARLAAPGKSPLHKLAASDLPVAIAQKLTGGTTVSGTVALAARAGIRVLATGGIGGVHRGASESFDVSQDLGALGRHPVAVICAGAKSVLDLPKTLEALEALGVPVIGIGTRELPAFYSTGSGLPLRHAVESPHEAAEICVARAALGQGGIVFAVPPPARFALAREEVERHLAAALSEAEREGISGNAVTPFLLAELARRSEGRTLAVNLALLEQNAGYAAQLACALAASPLRSSPHRRRPPRAGRGRASASRSGGRRGRGR